MTSSSSSSDVVDRIMVLGPFLHRATAERTLTTVLEALGARLTSDERERVATALPAPLAKFLRSQPAPGTPPNLFEDVAQRAHLPIGRARELSQVALRALGEILPSETRGRLARDLPELAATWVEPPAAPGSEGDEPALGVARHDLASGRPGSRRPLATADPSVLSHTHSVARSDAPHADTKLSSTRGLTQEREEETLAAARPARGRPLPS